MYGAILGDIIGSPFEFDRGDKTKDFQLFTEGCYYTDDTVMTIAVGEALIAVGPTATIEEIEDAVIANMKDWGKRYPNAGYGGSFRRWLKSKSPKPYGSYGNGSAMRVSAAGWLYDTLDRTREVARATANVTHNHPEGIKGAEATASAIFFARKGISKEDIKVYIENEFGYDLNRSLDEIRPGFSMDESCQGTVPEAIIAFLEGNDFEDTVRNAVSLGGDTDTLAAIAGSIAEAYYGIPSSLISECRNRLEDKFMIRVLDEFDYILGRKKDTDIEEELKRNIVIENAIENLYKSGNGDSITEVFDIIIDRMHEDGEVLVPYIMNDDLMLDKIAENLKVGNTFTLDHEVRLKLETVTDKEGKEWYAAFTSLLEIEKGTIGNVRMNISLENAFRWTIESNLEGIVINPFGKHVTINKDLAKEILSYYEQEKAEYQSSDEEERQEMISEIKMYCDELDMDYPDGFPDGMSNQEMREWIANWSEFDPFPELN